MPTDVLGIVSYAPVATARFKGADRAEIRVSDRAAPDLIRQAVVARVGELAVIVRDRAAGVRHDDTGGLVEGLLSTARLDADMPLSPRDVGRVRALQAVASGQAHRMHCRRSGKRLLRRSGDSADFGPSGSKIDSSLLDGRVRRALGFGLTEATETPRFLADPGSGLSVNPMTDAVIRTGSGAPVEQRFVPLGVRDRLAALVRAHRVQYGGQNTSASYGADALAALVKTRLRIMQYRRDGLLDGFIAETGLHFEPP